jgi:hypothetical protein
MFEIFTELWSLFVFYMKLIVELNIIESLDKTKLG